MVLLSAQGMSVANIAEVIFTSSDRGRDVIHDFNGDGVDSLSEVQGRSAPDVHFARAAQGKEAHRIQSRPSMA